MYEPWCINEVGEVKSNNKKHILCCFPPQEVEILNVASLSIDTFLILEIRFDMGIGVALNWLILRAEGLELVDIF